MKGDIIINMENVRFNGNVLDIGYNNYGVIYNICRYKNNEVNIEFFGEDSEQENNELDGYNSCALFLTFSKLLFKGGKNKLLDVIYNYLDNDGVLYIWDIDKKRGEVLDVNIKVILPYRKIKNIVYKDYNILKESNIKLTEELLKNKFTIVSSRGSNGIHYIKAQKKGINT